MRSMRILWGVLALSFAHGAWAADTGQQRAESAGSTLIGTPAPKLSLTTIDGKTLNLADYYGKKAVYLKFWATWCVPCLQQMPHFEHSFETAGPDLEVIAVNTNFNETPERVAAYRQKQGLKMPIVMDDGHLAAALNLRVTPQHVLIARDGRIAYVGHLADEHLDEALAAIQRPNSHAPKLARVQSRATGTRDYLNTLTGEHFSFTDPGHQQRTVLVFISPWCESYLKDSRPEYSAQCRDARLETQKLAADGRARWLSVASGLWVDEPDVREYQQKNALGMPLALDASGEVFRSYHVTAVPTVVVLGADGREVGRVSGDTSSLAAMLDKTRTKGG